MENESPTRHPDAGGEYRFNPWLFFGALAGPCVITSLIMIWERLDEVAYPLLIFGSIVAGLICGIHLAVTLGRNQTGGVKASIGIVSVIGCGLAAFALGLGGCLLIHGGGIH